MEKNERMDPAIWKGLFEQGAMAVEVDPKYGGTGASFMTTILIVEELAKVDGGVSVGCDVQNTLVNNMFNNFASPALQAEFLPRLASSEIGCFGLSESGSGSDAFALATTARKDGDSYVLNGEKMWITNALDSTVFLVMANVDRSKGYKGITCFVVDKKTDSGVKIGQKIAKLGIRSSSTCPIAFEDVRVPASRVLGEVGLGYKYAINLLNEGRIGIGAQMVGLAQGVFDHIMPYLFERKQFGQAIGTFQAMQAEYAQIATEIEAARLLVYNAARLKESGQSFVKEAAMCKLYAADVAGRAASKAIDWAGGIGYSREFPVEKYMRDAKIGQIYEGTSLIQKTTIAKLLQQQYGKARS